MSRINLISSIWRNKDKFRHILTLSNWAAFSRMMPMILKGTYKPMKFRNLLFGLGSIAYLLSPIDLIPEVAFLGFGLIDDMVILAFGLKYLHEEIQNFMAWESQSKEIVLKG